MRRDGRSIVLPLLASLVPVLGCGSSGSSASPTSDGGADAGRVADNTAQADRAACKYARGAMPSQTIGASTPIGADIPIDNIVVVMMENHSFDSYFGHLNQDGNRAGSDNVESADAGATNPLPEGGAAPWVHGSHLCVLDVDHGWDGTHVEIDNGQMDGFAARNDGTPVPAAPDGGTLDPSLGSGARAMWWYDQTDLPFYYQLADTFAIADHYLCSVPGPTWPNRRFLYAATSFGSTVTGLPLVARGRVEVPVSRQPRDHPRRARVEQDFVDVLLRRLAHPRDPLQRLRHPVAAPQGHRHVRRVSGGGHGRQAPERVLRRPQPAGSTSGSEPDEHPPGDIQEGQQFVSQVVAAMVASPQWAHTAIFITHDEHGGFYDHVAPPKACAPDSIPPTLSAGDTHERRLRYVRRARRPHGGKPVLQEEVRRTPRL